MNYFAIIDNQQQGPFTIDELRQRGIAQETLVWAEGMPQWVPAWQVEELKPLFFDQTAGSSAATPPPPPIMPQQPAPGSQAYQPNQPQQQPPKKKKGHGKLIAAAVIIVVALFILALTNPNKAEHRQAIMKKIDTATEQVDNISDPTARAIAHAVLGAGQGMVTEVVRQLVDDNLEYHNYIVFSTTSLHSDMLDHDIRCSTGFLGHVNAISLGNIMPDLIMRQLGVGGGKDGSHEEEQVTRTTEDADGNQTTVTTKTVKSNGVTIDSLTKKVTTGLAEEVGKQVKKQVRQETDSATASGIDGVVNAIVDFIKGL